MAVLVFGSEQVAEAQALISVLSLWLREVEPTQPARPAKAKFIYGSNGVARLVIDLEPEDGV